MEYKETILDAITGEITERLYSKEEIAIAKKVEAETDKKMAAFEAKMQEHAIAKSALLNRLGITAYEARLLLG